nr:M56 family metallopeptidase [Tahibacter harae]
MQLIGLVLLHFLWQGALVGAVFGLLRRVLAGGQPRYVLGLTCFAALIAAPLITAWLLLADTAAPAAAGLAVAAQGSAAPVYALQQGVLQPWMDYLPWLVACWGAGVAVLSLRALLHWHGLSRLIRRGTPLPEWDQRLRALCAQFGLGRVGLLYSAKVETPTLVGWIRPVILLPAAVALGFPAAQIELILAHELGHLRRWDHIVNLVQVVAETVLFYHPVVHWISRDLRDQREICCDELVLRMSKANPRDYVATLADLEQLRLDGPGALALSATGGVLLERVQHIAKVPPTRLDLRAPLRLLPLLAVSLAVIVLGYAQRAAWENSTMLALLAPQPLRELLLREAAPVQVSPLAVNDMTAGRTLRLPRLPQLAEPAPAPVAAAPVEAVPLASAAAPQVPALKLAPEAAAPVPVEAAVAAPAPAAAETAAAEPAPAATAPVAEKITLRDPIAAHAVQPAYPERALLRGVEGTVRLSYSLDEDGRVTDVRVEQHAPESLFDTAAVTALKKWRFVPGSFEAGSRRYSRLFVFALQGAGSKAGFAEDGVDPNECRMVTGTRICRRPGDVAQVELEAAALD